MSRLLRSIFTYFTTAVFCVVIILLSTSGYTKEEIIFLREDFNELDNWKPFEFPKIKTHTKYSIEKSEDGSYLKAVSESSASAIVLNEEFNVYECSGVRWRWKVNNVYKNGNAEEKSGDDYPARIYINFRYDPEKASIVKRIKYGIAKMIYGKYPPDSSLNYIWANRRHEKNVLPNKYTGESIMIILQVGMKNVGTWQEQDVDILKDFRRVFGYDPPSDVSIMVMNDSDDTGEKSVSFIDYIEVYK